MSKHEASLAQLAEPSGAGVGGVMAGGVMTGGVKAGGVKAGSVFVDGVAPPALQQRTIVYVQSQQDVPLTESPIEQQPSQA